MGLYLAVGLAFAGRLSWTLFTYPLVPLQTEAQKGCFSGIWQESTPLQLGGNGQSLLVGVVNNASVS